jgi:hypothetical protein
MTDEVTIRGKVVPGIHGASTVSVVKQMPHFIRLIPEMACCYEDTINIELEQPLLVENPDVATEYAWQGPGTAPERFYLHEIRIEFPMGSAGRTAWIYVPHNSPHFGNRNQVEVIAQKLEGLEYGCQCQIHIPNARTEAGVVVVRS